MSAYLLFHITITSLLLIKSDLIWSIFRLPKSNYFTELQFRNCQELNPASLKMQNFILKSNILPAYRNSWTLDARVGRWTLDAGLWTVDAGIWTLDFGRWTLDAGLWMLDSGLWTLGCGRYTLDALDTGHWTLSLTVAEQNQNPVSDFAWLSYWKFFRCESLRTS